MGKSNWIEIEFESPCNRLEVLKAIKQYGWEFTEGNQTSYLPLSNGEEFNWQYSTINFDELWNLIQKKDLFCETIGVSLTWKNSQIGGQIIFDTKSNLLFNVCLNPKYIIPQIGLVDTSWYLERLISPILQQGIKISSLKYEFIA